MSHGHFVWYDLMTPDPGAALAFYGAVVGWTGRDAGMPGASYTVLSAGAEGVGGIMPLPEAGTPPGWIGYVHADDVDAATAALAAGGGTVHKPPGDIPGIGRFAVVADPQGAAFILFTPDAAMQGEGPKPMAMGHGGWHELHAADWPNALDFYARQFGWTRDMAVDMGPMGTYQLFATGGGAVGGMMNKQAAMPRPAWVFYFNVPDIHAAVARIAAQGGQVVHGPQEVPGGSVIIQGIDPQGAMFALVQPAP